MYLNERVIIQDRVETYQADNKLNQLFKAEIYFTNFRIFYYNTLSNMICNELPLSIISITNAGPDGKNKCYTL